MLSMLTQHELSQLVLPVGELTKAEVRARGATGLRTASKPDSQDVCFIHSATGRQRFLADRIELHPGVVDADGATLGEVAGGRDGHHRPAQGSRRRRRPGERRYAVDVDVPGSGSSSVRRDVSSDRIALGPPTWVARTTPDGSAVPSSSTSAHGRVFAAASRTPASVLFDEPSARSPPARPSPSTTRPSPTSVLGSALAA